MDWSSVLKGIAELVLFFCEPLFRSVEHVPVIRVILGIILVFFLPGFAWTLVFFNNRQINLVERLALSLGLSIAIVTLSVLALHKLIGVRITGANSVLAVLAITVIPVLWYLIRRNIRKRRDGSAE